MGLQIANTSPNSLSDYSAYLSNISDEICVFQIPANPNVGDIYIIAGTGSGGWKITYNEGQFINYNGGTTTVSSGSLNSSKNTDCVTIISTFPPNEFLVINVVGNPTSL